LASLCECSKKGVTSVESLAAAITFLANSADAVKGTPTEAIAADKKLDFEGLVTIVEREIRDTEQCGVTFPQEVFDKLDRAKRAVSICTDKCVPKYVGELENLVGVGAIVRESLGVRE